MPGCRATSFWADAASVHPVPQGARVHVALLGGFHLHRRVQGGFTLLWTPGLMFLRPRDTSDMWLEDTPTRSAS